MTSSRPMPVQPMPLGDFSPAMRAAVGEHSSKIGLAFTGLLGKAGSVSDLFFPFYAALTKEENALGVKLTELIRLAVATTTGCEACLGYRDPRAIDAGMPADAPDLFDELDSMVFTERERSAIRYTLAFCTNHHLVDDAMWSQLTAQFDDMELMTLCLYVATLLGTSRFSHVVRLIDAQCTMPGYRLSAISQAKASQARR